MRRIPFTVASALLSELGERLVGKAHIALAELVKNSYDADATKVIIRFYKDQIEIIDNGHGMDASEFEHFWMRIGTPHKQEQRFSRSFKRPMTGSKGVGRLAVQFLASRIELRTVSPSNTNSELKAVVNWDEAVSAGELTRAEAECDEITRVTAFSDQSPCGTAIILSGLKHQWTANEIVDLAREIWWLQPPFRSNPDLRTEEQQAFEVELESPDEETVRKFETQMRASLEIWHARLVGKLIDSSNTNPQSTRTVRLSLEFAGNSPISTEYPVSDCKLHAAEFEIRVFHLLHRQPFGIKVDEARSYFNEFGGVHVYDSGFHLPYYGPENDWLGIEKDHSHRLSKSKLLPDELQVSEGLSFLPTQSRLFGVVHVNTSKEREEAKRAYESGQECLNISVTRDRLVDNKAFDNLRDIVRYALDFYAMREAIRQLEEAKAQKTVEPASQKILRVEEVLERYKDELPKPVYKTLRKEVQEAIAASEVENEILSGHTGLLGALATAGISAMAFEHEFNKQFHVIESLVEQLKTISLSDKSARQRRDEIAGRLHEWIKHARATRALFSFLMDEQNREIKTRHRAKSILDEVKTQVAVLTRGILIETSAVDSTLRLPSARFAEWSAIFQNVFINAVNAMLDSKKKSIHVSSRRTGQTRAVLVQDTGSGVDLSSADELFKPFVRKLKLSPERKALGFGGTGLGLTIVRMIADNLNCKVAFIEPDKGFNTAFQLSWKEKE